MMSQTLLVWGKTPNYVFQLHFLVASAYLDESAA